MSIEISKKVLRKLEEKHNVIREEVEQCFANREGKFLMDTREEHASNPPTMWFIAETDYGRKLKVVFVAHTEGTIYLRTAYEPNQTELRIYNKHGIGK